MSDKDASSSPDKRYAGLLSRFLALAVDFALLSAVFFPVTRVVKGVWLMSSADHTWVSGWFISDPLCLTFLVVIVLYFIWLEGIFGATVGKRVLGLRVVDLEGRTPGIRRATIRNLLRLVDALPVLNILGMVLIATSPERARYGDRKAGTRVVVYGQG